MTIAQLQRMLTTHQVTSRQLVELYMARTRQIDQSGPRLIKLAYAFERASKARRPPQFLPTEALP